MSYHVISLMQDIFICLDWTFGCIWPVASERICVVFGVPLMLTVLAGWRCAGWDDNSLTGVL